MKVTLHIGSGKTGTSSIQNFLNTNFNQLLKNSILYSMFLTPLNDSNILDQLGTEKTTSLSDKNIPSKIKLLNNIISKNNIKHFIWSLESLYYAPLDKIYLLKELLTYDEIEIIYFIRRQDLWFKSAFYQWGRLHKTFQGNDLISFEKFYVQRKMMGYYDQYIDNWVKVFGKKSIKIQPFEELQMPGGLTKTFCKLSGLDINKYKSNISFINTTFDHYTNDFIGIYNSQFSNNHYDADLVAMINNRIDHKKRKENFKEYGVLSEDIQNKIIDAYKETNEKIAREYLHRDDGILFYEPVTVIDNQIINDIDYNKLFQIVIEILLNQEKEIKNLKQRIL